ncbi:LacI family transcriptional regulator [Bacillaceae bacterium SIJ1]|uniref:LacI family DNA-binding transcriptional regulator n=1 Tax=Litoribacterium kuwaitense TaxID=1398745 RepID=UPI0013EBEFD1|nr:LacI family DNA-binding transcriptional regulator [Litoribacterium kuwaitense]NGP44764.1 LacI family transcriptional regulator [Litoribacterium kuwaitense]
MKKKVTMQTIANELGLSKSLVSKALANQTGVSEDTKELIRLTAARLGYRTNSSLKSVPSSKTGNVVVVLPREDLNDFEYWGKIISGIEEKLSEKQYSMILSGIDTSQSTSEGMPSCVSDRRVDGALILGRVPLSYVLAVQATGIPIVLVDTYHNQLKIDHVYAENLSGSYEATQYLLNMNHRKLGFVGDITYAHSFSQRFHGFNIAIQDFNSSANHRAEGFHYIDGAQDEQSLPYCPLQLENALLKHDRPTALVCGNDPIAIHVMQLLDKLAIHCPDDISIVGFDNLQKCKWVHPPLTSIDASKDLMGIRAVEMFLRRIETPELRPEHTMITTEIIERKSVKPASTLQLAKSKQEE